MMNKKQIAEMERDIATRTNDMQARQMPESSIRAMQKHVAKMAEVDSARNAVRRKKAIRALKYPGASTAALGQHQAAMR